MEIKLNNLLSAQLNLDKRINDEHGVSHQSTKTERFIALFVEIGELANATRAFKYWSLKPSDERAILLDEYADGLHFFLSLALVFNFNLTTVNYEECLPSKKAIVDSVKTVYERVAIFMQTESEDDYLKALKAFFTLGSALSFTPTDISDAYHAKLVVNYERQDTKY